MWTSAFIALASGIHSYIEMNGQVASLPEPLEETLDKPCLCLLPRDTSQAAHFLTGVSYSPPHVLSIG